MTDSLRKFTLPLAVGIVLLAAILRFAYYDTPHGMVDEAITVGVVGYMRQSGDWDPNWRKADLEPDMRYDQYNFASHHHATFYFYRAVKLIPGLEAWRSERGGFLVYRFFVALLATVAVAQTLRLGWRVAGAATGLGAGLFASVAPILVQDGHYVRPEPFTTVVMLAAAGLCLPGKRRAIARVLGAACCVGVLVACKVSLALVAWLPLIGLAFAARERPRRWWWALAVPPAILAGFAAGAPTALTHLAEFRNGIEHLARQYAGIHPPHSHYDPAPVADMMLSYFSATLGWGLLAAFAAGLVALARTHGWRHVALLAGPVLVFAGYFATRSVFFERNLSHVVPLFCIVAALGVVALGGQAAGRLGPATPWMIGAAFALLALRPASYSRGLVFTEFSGRGYERHERFEAELRARFPEAEWLGEFYVGDGDEESKQLIARQKTSGRPALIRITDYRDERSARQIADLGRRISLETVAIDEGTFPRLPTCTLLTYHSSTQRFYVVPPLRRE